MLLIEVTKDIAFSVTYSAFKASLNNSFFFVVMKTPIQKIKIYKICFMIILRYLSDSFIFTILYLFLLIQKSFPLRVDSLTPNFNTIKFSSMCKMHRTLQLCSSYDE